jgi:hypothetical protein
VKTYDLKVDLVGVNTRLPRREQGRLELKQSGGDGILGFYWFGPEVASDLRVGDTVRVTVEKVGKVVA